MFKMICAGRLDLAPIDLEVGQFLLKMKVSKECREKVVYHERTLLKQALHIIGSPKIDTQKWESLDKAIFEGLQTLKKSGRFDEIMWNLKMGKFNE